MKKICTLLSIIFFATAATAQQAHKGLIFTPGSAVEAKSISGPSLLNTTTTEPQAIKEGHKTTSWIGSSGGRWYDYLGWTQPEGGILSNNTLISYINHTDLPIWQDTSTIWGDWVGSGNPYAGNPFTSCGLGFDPRYPAWNDPYYFPSLAYLSISDSFVIDSVIVPGWYGRNNSKPAIVDTLVLTFVQGNGTPTANNPTSFFSDPVLLSHYGITTGNLNYLSLGHDSMNNRAGNLTGGTTISVPASQVYKFPLRVVDTNYANCYRGTQYPRPASGHPGEPIINFPVIAGNYAVMTVSFISGDTLPATYLPSGYRDTVRYSDGTAIIGHKYGNFSMAVAYVGFYGVPDFPPYNWGAGDHTSGYFKKEGASGASWGGLYEPNWNLSTVSGTHASVLQYPEIVYHIKCPTGYLNIPPQGNINNQTSSGILSITPNPANDELNITLTDNTPATITLTNMLGQVVASQNVTIGHTTINTSALPAGMYVYTLSANGGRTTGRVVVAH